MVSILTSIKKLLGIVEEDESFDTDVIMFINSAFFNLNQLGVGPTTTFYITDKITKWSDFSSDTDIEALKIYIYLNVRLTFDPPQMSHLLESIKSQILELSWRLLVYTENKTLEEE